MGMRLYKTTESHEFGDRQLIDFLEKHGGEIGHKPVMDIPASAFRAALENAECLAYPKRISLSWKANWRGLMMKTSSTSTTLHN